MAARTTRATEDARIERLSMATNSSIIEGNTWVFLGAASQPPPSCRGPLQGSCQTLESRQKTSQPGYLGRNLFLVYFELLAIFDGQWRDETPRRRVQPPSARLVRGKLRLCPGSARRFHRGGFRECLRTVASVRKLEESLRISSDIDRRFRVRIRL